MRPFDAAMNENMAAALRQAIERYDILKADRETLLEAEAEDGIPPELSAKWDATMARYFG